MDANGNPPADHKSKKDRALETWKKTKEAARAKKCAAISAVGITDASDQQNTEDEDDDDDDDEVPEDIPRRFVSSTTWLKVKTIRKTPVATSRTVASQV